MHFELSNSDTCKELLRYRNTVAVMEDPQRLLHQVKHTMNPARLVALR